MKPFSSISTIWVLVIILGLVGASCAVQVITDRRPSTASEPDAATTARVQAVHGRLPLHFEANQGQTDEQVKFLSRGNGYTLFLTPTEAVLALTETRGHGDAETRGYGNSRRVHDCQRCNPGCSPQP